MHFLKSASLRGEESRQVLLLMGPVGAGKSALTEHIKDALDGETYYQNACYGCDGTQRVIWYGVCEPINTPPEKRRCKCGYKVFNGKIFFGFPNHNSGKDESIFLKFKFG